MPLSSILVAPPTLIQRLGNYLAERCSKRLRLGWLECLLLTAGVTLLYQMFPATGARVIRSLDFRNWGIAAWVCFAIVTARLVMARRQCSDWQEALAITGKWLIGFAVCLVLILAAARVLHSFPKAETWVLANLNPRRWSKSRWWYLNLSALAVALIYRFVPELVSDWTRKHAKDIARKQLELDREKRREYREHIAALKRRGEKGIDFY